MIDYNKPDHDPIVAEVRCAREQFAARFNYDLKLIGEEFQRNQSTSGRRYSTMLPQAPKAFIELKKKAG